MASAADKRKAQNRGVKAGTVRIGAKGKTVRKYNAKTGRWDVTAANVKSYKAALGQKSRPTSASSKTTDSTKRRGGYTGGPTSIDKTSNKKYSNLSPSARGTEGPKRSAPRKSSWESFANNPVGYVTKGSSNRVVANRTSDFPKGSTLQLKKTNQKDASGRVVYRWVKAVSPKK